MPVVVLLLPAGAQHVVKRQSLRRRLQESIGSLRVPTDTFQLLLRDRRLPFGVGRNQREDGPFSRW